MIQMFLCLAFYQLWIKLIFPLTNLSLFIYWIKRECNLWATSPEKTGQRRSIGKKILESLTDEGLSPKYLKLLCKCRYHGTYTSGPFLSSLTWNCSPDMKKKGLYAFVIKGNNKLFYYKGAMFKKSSSPRAVHLSGENSKTCTIQGCNQNSRLPLWQFVM